MLRPHAGRRHHLRLLSLPLLARSRPHRSGIHPYCSPSRMVAPVGLSASHGIGSHGSSGPVTLIAARVLWLLLLVVMLLDLLLLNLRLQLLWLLLRVSITAILLNLHNNRSNNNDNNE